MTEITLFYSLQAFVSHPQCVLTP